MQGVDFFECIDIFSNLWSAFEQWRFRMHKRPRSMMFDFNPYGFRYVNSLKISQQTNGVEFVEMNQGAGIRHDHDGFVLGLSKGFSLCHADPSRHRHG